MGIEAPQHRQPPSVPISPPQELKRKGKGKELTETRKCSMSAMVWKDGFALVEKQRLVISSLEELESKGDILVSDTVASLALPLAKEVPRSALPSGVMATLFPLAVATMAKVSILVAVEDHVIGPLIDDHPSVKPLTSWVVIVNDPLAYLVVASMARELVGLVDSGEPSAKSNSDGLRRANKVDAGKASDMGQFASLEAKVEYLKHEHTNLEARVNAFTFEGVEA
ncbi:hypothetical protein GUJ93_ZPchr0009g993 [Zizania palustris]|uniref:Uncharacterized protein n=1 Tax=Zizania palustris TaxID=103762 RepID=A0A8J5REF1_ZIZPA|nr:hypothetical protein GUJ93_ZPchr0009g993 [Zizania palustris]